MLSFEVALNPQGKKKAVAVRVAEVHSGGSRLDASRQSRTASLSVGAILGGIAMLAMIVLVAWSGHRRYIRSFPPSSVEATPAQVSRELPQSRAPAAARFTCDGRTHCSQMTSCEEATFFLKNCPGTKMDGDHDGIPCERQLCN